MSFCVGVPKEKVEPEEEHTDVVKPVAKTKRAKSVPPMPRRPRVPSPPDTRKLTSSSHLLK